MRLPHIIFAYAKSRFSHNEAHISDWCSFSVLDTDEEPSYQKNHFHDELELDVEPAAFEDIHDTQFEHEKMCDIDIDDINIFNDIDYFNQTRVCQSLCC